MASNLFKRITKLHPYSCALTNSQASLGSLAARKPTNIASKVMPKSRNKATSAESDIKTTNLPKQQQQQDSEIDSGQKSSVMKAKYNFNEWRNFVTNFMATTSGKTNATIGTTRRISALEGFKEFFCHPLTWDRNNGYFNILLCLAIFGYCFSVLFSIETDAVPNVSHEKKGKN